MAERNIKTIALRFNLDNDLEKQCYERILELDGGTFRAPSAYVRTLVMKQLFKSKNYEGEYIEELTDKIAAKVIDKISTGVFSEDEDIPDYVNV